MEESAAEDYEFLRGVGTRRVPRAMEVKAIALQGWCI